MKKKFLILVAAVAIVPAWSADTSTNLAGTPTPDQVMAQFRSDLQAKSADVMAKGLTLTADQAAKFWPLFQEFQKEQGNIVDAQFKMTQKYAENYTSLSDAAAMEFINGLLERDSKMQQLRMAWLKKFQTVVPAKVAARAIQLDRRLGNVTQVRISSQIPLIE